MVENSANFFYKNNRLQQLRGFCAAMQFGNLSHAAEHLGLSHTAISLQVKSLEQDLKIKLFERKGPKIKPTKDAELLYKMSLPHVEAMSDVYDQFITLKKKEESDEIKIGANNSAISFIMPKLLKTYLQEHPGMYARVIFAEQEEGLEKLKNGEIDVLCIPRREHNPIDTRFFEYTPMFYYTPVLLSLHDHPLAGKKRLTIEEICKYDITMPSKGLTVIPHLDELLSGFNKLKRLRITLENWSNTLKFIEAGLVVSIVADLAHEGREDILCRTPLTHLFPVIDYGFIVNKSSRHSQKIRQFFEVAKSNSAALSSDILPKKRAHN